MPLQLTTWHALVKRGGLAVEIRLSVHTKETGCTNSGEYIKQSRIERGMRQKDLASLVEVHKGTSKFGKLTGSILEEGNWIS